MRWPARAYTELMGWDDGLGALVGRARDLCASAGQGGVICSGRERASLPVNLMWIEKASRPRARALGHQRVVSYEATMGAMAYAGHRKAAVGWTEGCASAASAVCHG